MIRNERYSKLIAVIEKNPGIKFREIMRATYMKNGVLSHYLRRLETSGTIQVKRESKETRYFPLHISENEKEIIKSLRRETPRRILHTLMVNGELKFNEIVKNVSKAPSTVSLYISQLVDAEIVGVTITEHKHKFYIKDKSSVDQMIEQYQPGILDKPTTGLEDIINSL